jgi:protocatechuate 3,4-dioxygenase beta subunit
MGDKPVTITRRAVVAGGGALALATVAIPRTARSEAALKPTGQETFGPFYPVRAPQSHDTDLTHYPGRTQRARGQVIELSGRVLDTSGRPLPRAQMTVWQANAAGRYTNPVDKNPAPLDPNFLGVVSFGVAADGRYRLRTVKPGPYPEPSGTMRTPHIHFDVTHDDYRLAAQMYFPDEPLNDKDLLLSTLKYRHRDPAAAICRRAPAREPGVMAFEWDIVLLT